MNWIANESMKKLLRQCGDEQLNLPSVKVSALRELLFPPFRAVRDCVILSEMPAEELDAAFDQAMEKCFDKTDYEACNTETRIDCFFEDALSREQGFEIALLALETWAFQLKCMQPEARFCMILACDEDHTEIRFHKLREGESLWLNDDINHYTDGAIGYFIL